MDFIKRGQLWEPLVAQELQQQMTQTGGADPDDTGLLGIIISAGDIDFGYVETFGFTRNADKAELLSRRAAVRQVVKSRTTRVSIEITWSTHSIKNASIITAWNGSTEGVNGSVLTSPMTVDMPGEEGEPGLTLDIPSADIEGNGIDGTFAESFMQLSFRATATLDADATTLAKLAILAAAGG